MHYNSSKGVGGPLTFLGDKAVSTAGARPVTYTMDKVCAAINSLPSDTFLNNEITEITSLTSNHVSSYLSQLASRSEIENIGWGKYKKLRIPVCPGSVAKGVIAEATYLALDKNRSRWLSLSEIVALAEDELVNTSDDKSSEGEVNIYYHVASIISIWKKNRSLKREGSCGKYLYQLFDHILTRPSTKYFLEFKLELSSQ